MLLYELISDSLVHDDAIVFLYIFHESFTEMAILSGLVILPIAAAPVCHHKSTSHSEQLLNALLCFCVTKGRVSLLITALLTIYRQNFLILRICVKLQYSWVDLNQETYFHISL